MVLKTVISKDCLLWPHDSVNAKVQCMYFVSYFRYYFRWSDPTIRSDDPIRWSDPMIQSDDPIRWSNPKIQIMTTPGCMSRNIVLSDKIHSTYLLYNSSYISNHSDVRCWFYITITRHGCIWQRGPGLPQPLSRSTWSRASNLVEQHCPRGRDLGPATGPWRAHEARRLQWWRKHLHVLRERRGERSRRGGQLVQRGEGLQVQ